MPDKTVESLAHEAKIGDLILDNLNANQGTERGDALLGQSLQKLGAGRSILLDKNGRVIAGNKTVAKFGEVGLEDVVIVRTDGKKLVAVQRTDLDLDSPEGREMALADNRVSEVNLSWDTEILAEIGQDVDLEGWFTEDEMAGWDVELDDFDPPSDEQDEETTADLIEQAEEGGIESRVTLGQIWKLGRHLIACGDSTDEGNVRKLLGGVLADCCWTDPPYGVSYVGKTADALTIENDGDKNLPEFIKAAFRSINVALKPGSAVYVAHPSNALQQVFVNQFVESFSLRQQLVWVKNTFALGRSDYHYRHEPILFGYTNGGDGRRGRGGDNWHGDNCQDSVFEVDKPSRNGVHPTMKPIELIEAMLVNSTHGHSVLFEPFLGSGSTLIAAQKMPGSRTVYGFELSPDYCEVIIRRWEEFTGGVAELAGHL